MHTVDQINEQALSFLEQGMSPAEFDLAALTGLSQAQIKACQTTGKTNHLHLGHYDDTHWQRGGRLSKSIHVNVRGQGSRKAIYTSLAPILSTLGIYAYLECGAYEIITTKLLQATEGMLAVYLPDPSWQKNIHTSLKKADGNDLTNLQINGEAYTYLSRTIRDHVLANKEWKALSIDGLDTPVAAYSAARGELILFINLGLTNTWSSWSASKRTRTVDPAIWTEIFTQAIKVLPTVKRRNGKTILTPQMVQAYETAQNWRALHLQATSPISSLRGDYIHKREQAELMRDQSRHRLIETQKSIAVLKKQLNQARTGNREMLKQAIKMATGYTDQIARLKGVSCADGVQIENLQGLRIKLQDVVLLEEVKNIKRLVPGLVFEAALKPNKGYYLKFFETEKYQHYQLHPHVFKHGKHPCFGEAQLMLAKAAELGDMIMFINVITRWAANSMQDANYLTGLQGFPATDLALGFQDGAWDNRPDKDKYPNHAIHDYIDSSGQGWPGNKWID